MRIRKLRIDRLVKLLVVLRGWRLRHAQIIPTQFDLLRGTVPRRKPFAGKQRLVFSHILMILLVLALHLRGRH